MPRRRGGAARARAAAVDDRRGAAVGPAGRGRGRRPQLGPRALTSYSVLQQRARNGLALTASADRGFSPAFVARYLECGILAHGFARARCGECGHDFLIAFSCKGRGVCPSCNARHMAETAAHLVDQVFPPLPVRQWVLSVPKRLRYFLQPRPRGARRGAAHLPAGDRGAAASTQRLRGGRLGAVSFVQRFGSALNAHVHFHCCVIDGVFAVGRGRAGPILSRPVRQHPKTSPRCSSRCGGAYHHRLVYRFAKPQPDGRTALHLTPLELLEPSRHT